jgi:tripartite-type tricarboxylate transporter receptor subunit TctC
MHRRRFLTCALSAIALAPPAGFARAQLGEQPIRIVFPFAAGGSGDALARVLADAMRTELGRAVIVENRTGAAGRIGVQAVKAAAPDGSTLLLTPIAPVAVFARAAVSNCSMSTTVAPPPRSPTWSVGRCRCW